MITNLGICEIMRNNKLRIRKFEFRVCSGLQLGFVFSPVKIYLAFSSAKTWLLWEIVS